MVPQALAKPAQDFRLEGQAFVTWVRSQDTWKRFYTLVFDNRAIVSFIYLFSNLKPHLNNSALVTTRKAASELSQIEVQWEYANGNEHSGFAMFYKGAKSGYYWATNFPDSLVFTGWFQSPGQQRMDFRGVCVPASATPDEIANNVNLSEERGLWNQIPTSTQTKEEKQAEPTETNEDEERDTELLRMYGEQIKLLYTMGFTDVRLNLHLLESSGGDLTSVVDHLSG